MITTPVILESIILISIVIASISNLMVLLEILKYIQKKDIKSKSSTTRRSLPKATRRYLLDQSGSKCAACSRECCSPHIDHILPVALGGTDELDNLQVLCAACNLHKGARHE